MELDGHGEAVVPGRGAPAKQPGAGSTIRNLGEVTAMLVNEVGLTEEEARLYLKLLSEGHLPLDSPSGAIAKMKSEGMLILSGNGKRYVPVHPRLAVANHYRTWREAMVREINERRLRVDRLIIELIPLYEAAMEKKMRSGGG